MDLTWLPFDLHPEIPEGGVELDEAFGGRGQGYARQLRTQIAELAEEAELPFEPPTHISRTRLALEVSEVVRRGWPESFDGLHRSLFEAYWGRGLDIEDPEIVFDLVETAGAPAVEVRSKIEDPAVRALVDAATKHAHELGVTGTPSWLIGGLLVPGAQPRETFDRIIERMLEREPPDEATTLSLTAGRHPLPARAVLMREGQGWRGRSRHVGSSRAVARWSAGARSGRPNRTRVGAPEHWLGRSSRESRRASISAGQSSSC